MPLPSSPPFPLLPSSLWGSCEWRGRGSRCAQYKSGSCIPCKRHHCHPAECCVHCCTSPCASLCVLLCRVPRLPPYNTAPSPCLIFLCAQQPCPVSAVCVRGGGGVLCFIVVPFLQTMVTTRTVLWSLGAMSRCVRYKSFLPSDVPFLDNCLHASNTSWSLVRVHLSLYSVTKMH